MFSKFKVKVIKGFKRLLKRITFHRIWIFDFSDIDEKNSKKGGSIKIKLPENDTKLTVIGRVAPTPKNV